MRLAVSNLAWEPVEDEAVAEVLRDAGVQAVELAPTKVFPDPLAASSDDVERVREGWRERGFEISALQSLLFGRPDLLLFADREARDATRDRLIGFVRLAAALGAARLVFGSPANRRVPDGMPSAEAEAIAVEVFGAIGAAAVDEGVVFCIEPNPRVYGCNFVTTSDEGAALVRAVGSAGFGLHLDVAGATLAGESPAAAVRDHAGELCYLHISAPSLGALETDVVDHAAAGRALAESPYRGFGSIEMRPGPVGGNASRVAAAVALAQRYYPIAS